MIGYSCLLSAAIHCSGQGLFLGLSARAWLLETQSLNFQHLLVCKGALPPGISQGQCPGLGGNGWWS